jgi:hypothetical protein
MVDSIQGLRADGRLVAMGADVEPISVSLMDLIGKRIRNIGSQQNGPEYLYDALDFVRKEKLKRLLRHTHWQKHPRRTSGLRRVSPGFAPSSQCKLPIRAVTADFGRMRDYSEMTCRHRASGWF